MAFKDVKPYVKGDKLTPKQEIWINEYLKTNNSTEASIKAGYSEKSARHLGYQNSLKFKDLIEERRQEYKQSLKSDTIAELEDIFTFWTTTFMDETNKLSDRIKASELLAKAKGGFIEKVEVKEVDTDWFV